MTRMFVFGAADYQSNGLQYLDLRAVYTGGFGFHIIKSDNTTLNVLAGLNYTHEVYSNGALKSRRPRPRSSDIFVSYGVTNRFVALTLGEELITNWARVRW